MQSDNVVSYMDNTGVRKKGFKDFFHEVASSELSAQPI
jgi:hypothetical protein